MHDALLVKDVTWHVAGLKIIRKAFLSGKVRPSMNCPVQEDVTDLEGPHHFSAGINCFKLYPRSNFDTIYIHLDGCRDSWERICKAQTTKTWPNT